MMDANKVSFKGLDAVRVEKGGIGITVLTQRGPRIVELERPGCKNLLFWDDEAKYRREDWWLMGGHRVWFHIPGADESELTYLKDNGQCKVSRSIHGVEISGEKDLQLQIQRGITIKESDTENSLDIVNWVRNQSNMLFSCGVWSLTCTKPDDKMSYAVPLGNGTQWDVYSVVGFRKWAGHSSPGVGDTQFKWGKDLLIVNPQGTETKIIIEVPRGWMGCYAPDLGYSFFKLVKHNPNLVAQYPKGCNMAFYIGPENFMVEMETMSPWKTLRPGESLEHTERWVITDPIPWDKPFHQIQFILAEHQIKI